MKIRTVSILTLALSSFSFPSLVKASEIQNNIKQLAIAMHVADEITPLGSFTLDGIDQDLIREFPWQISLSFDRGDNFDSNFPHAVVIDFTLTILHTTLGEDIALNFQRIPTTFNDDDLDLFLVNAPGGDSSVRFGGTLVPTHIPEPSTFSLVLLAAVCFPFRTRGVQNRNG